MNAYSATITYTKTMKIKVVADSPLSALNKAIENGKVFGTIYDESVYSEDLTLLKERMGMEELKELERIGAII